LGTRHRAAIGISEVSDSLTIVVSEETGRVSVAYRGEIFRNLDADGLRAKLQQLQKLNVEKPAKGMQILRRLKNEKQILYRKILVYRRINRYISCGF
jgi:diadenylate cyclase